MIEPSPENQEPYTDVNYLLGSDVPCRERDLFNLYKAHFERCKRQPSVFNFRLCVEAYDALMECFEGPVR